MASWDARRCHTVASGPSDGVLGTVTHVSDWGDCTLYVEERTPINAAWRSGRPGVADARRVAASPWERPCGLPRVGVRPLLSAPCGRLSSAPLIRLSLREDGGGLFHMSAGSCHPSRRACAELVALANEPGRPASDAPHNNPSCILIAQPNWFPAMSRAGLQVEGACPRAFGLIHVSLVAIGHCGSRERAMRHGVGDVRGGETVGAATAAREPQRAAPKSIFMTEWSNKRTPAGNAAARRPSTAHGCQPAPD